VREVEVRERFPHRLRVHSHDPWLHAINWLLVLLIDPILTVPDRLHVGTIWLSILGRTAEGIRKVRVGS
jgi:hypothetical protein